ncbi:MAG TPA: flagellar type III secretion system pore protein FliP [Nocardioides sp.]|nr:flagellar type III secretion system pore protein FliP [Nocardioides sp.]
MLAWICLQVLAAGPSDAAQPDSVPGLAQVSVATDPLPTDPTGPDGPRGPQGPSGDKGDDATINVELDGLTDKPGNSVLLLIGLSMLALLPAIMLSCTSFTKIFVVLGLTRNALGLQQTPPNQVLAGLALFLSLFIMGPVLSDINEAAIQPYLNGEMKTGQAYYAGIEPLRDFMLKQVDDEELKVLTSAARRDLPENPDEVPMSTLIPSFVLSELEQAFIIGFIIFIPFLVIDMVVSGGLMAMGMMMMPPSIVSLPFKLLLFVLVDGWALVVKALVGSYG